MEPLSDLRALLQAALTAAMENLKLDGNASTWSLENFASAVAAHRPALSWAAVAERLDCPGFAVQSEAAFQRLVSLEPYRICVAPGHNQPPCNQLAVL